MRFSDVEADADGRISVCSRRRQQFAVRPHGQAFEIVVKVECRTCMAHDIWKLGTIVSMKDDGSFEVDFDEVRYERQIREDLPNGVQGVLHRISRRPV